MRISEVIELLMVLKDDMGDVEVVILSGKWKDCRSSDKQWPIVNEVIAIRNQNKAAICTEHNEQ